MKKKKVVINGHTNYLLGEKDGVEYYLLAPSWALQSYWSVGRVNTYDYDNNIKELLQFDDLFLKCENDKDKFLEMNSPFKEVEKFKILEIMKQLHLYKNIARLSNDGNLGVALVEDAQEIILNKIYADKINNDIIPKLWKCLERTLYDDVREC